MDSADCKNYAGLVKTLEKFFNVKLGLCQTDCRQMPVFSRLSKYTLHMYHPPSTCLRVNMGCAWVILFPVRSLYVSTKSGHLYRAISGSPQSLDYYTPNWARSIFNSIEAQCDHHIVTFSTDSGAYGSHTKGLSVRPLVHCIKTVTFIDFVFKKPTNLGLALEQIRKLHDNRI